jgi:predicted metal-binding membrane protein
VTPAARDRARVRTPLLVVSAAAWIALAFAPHGLTVTTYCSLPVFSPLKLKLLLVTNPLASLGVGWGLMVAAMMLPLLVDPLRHAHAHTFAGRWLRTALLFLLGYAAVWTLAAVPVVLLAMALRLATIPFGLTIAIVLLWECSPIKQRYLNRCHFRPALADFGYRADIAALRFGLSHGSWCVRSCFVLMVLPMLANAEQMTAMIVVALWVLAQRVETPTAVRWRLRIPAKAARVVSSLIRRQAFRRFTGRVVPQHCR